MQSKDSEIVEQAGACGGPAVLACVNLQNLKIINVLLGHDRGDRILASVEAALRSIGPTWRTGGDEFVVLVDGSLEAATRSMQALSWLFHLRLTATEAWRIKLEDGRLLPLVPWRSFEVACTPRCGLAAVGASAQASLDDARRRCEELRAIDPAAQPAGFAPLARAPWAQQHDFGGRGCPVCGQDGPDRIDEDLGWTREHCRRCMTTYERTEVVCVLGELETGGDA